MALVVELADKDAAVWTDITDQTAIYDRMRVGGVAHHGEIGTGSSFDLHDDAGALDLPVKRVVRIRETATSPDTILLRGRIAGVSVLRGEMPVADARRVTVELDDHNADLRGIPIRRWSRPAETDYQRVIALWRRYLKGRPRTSTRLRIGYVRNANRASLVKHTYRETDPFGLLSDIAEEAGKDFFVTANGILFYDLATSQRFAADLAITDDDPDMVSEFPPIWGAGGRQDGSEFASGATLIWGDGDRRVAAVRASVETAHDYWRVIVSDEARGASDARQRLRALLSRQARAVETYSVSIDLAEDQVDMVRYGQTVSFRSAAAGVSSPVVLRVARLMWEPLAPGLYRAHLELGFPKKLAPRLRRRALTTATPGGQLAPSSDWHLLDDFERPWGGPAVVAMAQGEDGVGSPWQHTITLPAGVGSGDLLLIILAVTSYGGGYPSPATPTGWTDLDADGMGDWYDGGNWSFRAWSRVADGSEGSTVTVTDAAVGTTHYASWIVLRIEGHDAASEPERAYVYDDGSGNIVLPSLTPSWGEADTLWLAAALWSVGDGWVSPFSYPATFTDRASQLNSLGPDDQAGSVAIASRQLRAATEPGGDSYVSVGGAGAGIGITIAIRPGSSGA